MTVFGRPASRPDVGDLAVAAREVHAHRDHPEPPQRRDTDGDERDRDRAQEHDRDAQGTKLRVGHELPRRGRVDEPVALRRVTEQDGGSDARRRDGDAVHDQRRPLVDVVAVDVGRERDQRDQPQHREIERDEAPVDPPYHLEHPVMPQPQAGDDEEAQRVGEDLWEHVAELVPQLPVEVGRLEPEREADGQHEQRRRDREHRVAEVDQPVELERALAPLAVRAHPASSTPSRASRNRLVRTPEGPYPPMRPPLATTRWHGTTIGTGLRLMALPTARAAPGRPAISASSPYETVSPNRTSRCRVSYTARGNGASTDDRSTGIVKRRRWPRKYSSISIATSSSHSSPASTSRSTGPRPICCTPRSPASTVSTPIGVSCRHQLAVTRGAAPAPRRAPRAARRW